VARCLEMTEEEGASAYGGSRIAEEREEPTVLGHGGAREEVLLAQLEGARQQEREIEPRWGRGSIDVRVGLHPGMPTVGSGGKPTRHPAQRRCVG
jgi:hypothetical protein